MLHQWGVEIWMFGSKDFRHLETDLCEFRVPCRFVLNVLGSLSCLGGSVPTRVRTCQVILKSGLGILYLYPHYAILDINIQSFHSRKIRSLMELILFPIHLIDLNKKLCLPNIFWSSVQTLLKRNPHISNILTATGNRSNSSVHHKSFTNTCRSPPDPYLVGRVFVFVFTDTCRSPPPPI